MGKKERIFPISEVGGRIQKRRHELKMSRSDLYDYVFNDGKAGSDSSKDRTVLNWESNATELNYDTLPAMCRALECSADYLLGIDECTNKSTQFIHEYTGLSETTIKQLHNFTTYHQGKIRLTVMDFLLRDTSFTHELMDMINNYFEKYYRYEHNKKIFSQEEEKEKNLDFDEFLSYNPTVSKRKLKEYEDVKEATHFNVQKKFDNILENFMKLLYKKYSDKAPDTN